VTGFMDATEAVSLSESIEQFSVFYPFQFDPFQLEAMLAFLEGKIGHGRCSHGNWKDGRR
jgi:hypothetical protein